MLAGIRTYQLDGGIRLGREGRLKNAASKVLVDQTSAAEANFVLIIKGSSELALMVVITVRFGVVDSSNIDNNVGLLNNGRITGADDVSILILRKLLQHPASQSLIAVEGA